MSNKKSDAATAESVWRQLAGLDKADAQPQSAETNAWDVLRSPSPALSEPLEADVPEAVESASNEVPIPRRMPDEEASLPEIIAQADEVEPLRKEAPTHDSDGEETSEAKAASHPAPVPARPILRAEPLVPDEDGKLVPVPGNGFSFLFRLFGYAPIILTLALLAAQVAFTLDARELWYSDEVRHANALQNMLESQNWLTLEMDGQEYPDKPPVYFWFLAALHSLLGIPVSPMLFFLGTAISGALLLLSTHMMSRLVGRVDGRTSLAAGVILLTGFFLSGLLHYSRMDLMFAACITFSHIAIYLALIRQRAASLMILGFLLAGLAVLIKGPFGLAFPLAAAIGFCLWQGKPLRLFRPDMLLGILAGLLLPALWLGAAYMEVGPEFLDNILGQQVARRALNTWHHGQNWLYYLYMLPLIFLPWSLFLLFLPWGRLFARSTRQGLKESRGPERSGLAYLWSVVITGLLLASAVSIKLPIYLLPLFPALAILCGRGMLLLSPMRARLFSSCIGAILLVLALAFVLVPYLAGIEVDTVGLLAPLAPLAAQVRALPVMPEGRLILAGICALAGCAFLFLPGRSRPEALLLLMALFTAGFSYPLWSVSAPSLDAFMSPRAQAEAIRGLKQEGFAVYAVRVYPGTYAYYAGTVPRLKNWDAVLEKAARQPKIAVATRASDWDQLADKAGFREVHRQVIAERPYVVVVRDASSDTLPAVPAPADDKGPERGLGNETPPDDQSRPPLPESEHSRESILAPAEGGLPPLESPDPPAAAPSQPAAPTEPDAPAGALPQGTPPMDERPLTPAGSLPLQPQAPASGKAAPTAESMRQERTKGTDASTLSGAEEQGAAAADTGTTAGAGE